MRGHPGFYETRISAGDVLPGDETAEMGVIDAVELADIHTSRPTMVRWFADTEVSDWQRASDPVTVCRPIA